MTAGELASGIADTAAVSGYPDDYVLGFIFFGGTFTVTDIGGNSVAHGSEMAGQWHWLQCKAITDCTGVTSAYLAW